MREKLQTLLDTASGTGKGTGLKAKLWHIKARNYRQAV